MCKNAYIIHAQCVLYLPLYHSLFSIPKLRVSMGAKLFLCTSWMYEIKKSTLFSSSKWIFMTPNAKQMVGFYNAVHSCKSWNWWKWIVKKKVSEWFQGLSSFIFVQSFINCSSYHPLGETSNLNKKGITLLSGLRGKKKILRMHVAVDGLSHSGSL